MVTKPDSTNFVSVLGFFLILLLSCLNIVKPAMSLMKALWFSTQYTHYNRHLAGQEWGSAHSCCAVFHSWCHLHRVPFAGSWRAERRVHILSCQESGGRQPSATISVPHTPSEPRQPRWGTRRTPGQCLCPFGCHQAKLVPLKECHTLSQNIVRIPCRESDLRVERLCL